MVGRSIYQLVPLELEPGDEKRQGRKHSENSSERRDSGARRIQGMAGKVAIWYNR
eukprot:COSAG06_NODE_1944_length_8009_cov_3.197598_5_plen_54_part_01